MTTENKESMYHKLDKQRVIRDFADAICGDDGKKADVFFNSCSRYFEWSGGRLFFKKAGGEKIAATDPTVKQFFAEEYAFLLPAPKAEEHEFEGVNVTIDPLTVESALGGNITSKGAIAKIFGARPDASAAVQTAAAEKTELFLQAERVKRNVGERERDDGGKFKTKASNPWSLEGWNLTKQMQTHRADPALAERLAKAANSRVGAARPTKVA
jgi:hypothetical protein